MQGQPNRRLFCPMRVRLLKRHFLKAAQLTAVQLNCVLRALQYILLCVRFIRTVFHLIYEQSDVITQRFALALEKQSRIGLQRFYQCRGGLAA